MDPPRTLGRLFSVPVPLAVVPCPGLPRPAPDGHALWRELITGISRNQSYSVCRFVTLPFEILNNSLSLTAHRKFWRRECAFNRDHAFGHSVDLAISRAHCPFSTAGSQRDRAIECNSFHELVSDSGRIERARPSCVSLRVVS